MPGVILSVDIGTSSLKAAFIDFDGRPVAFDRVAYTADSTGKVTAEAWEKAFAGVLKSLRTQAPGEEIDALCISGNGPTLVPVTKEAEALPPLYWYDGRTYQPEGQAQKEILSFFLPRAAWLKENAQDEYKRVSLFLSSHEWLASRLGAEELTVLPSTRYEPYYWDADQCCVLGLNMEKFPPFIEMGNLMGKVSAEAARICGQGLKSGIPIVSGGPDFITALIGTKTVRPGDVCDRAGSSEGINICAVEAAQVSAGLRVLPHAASGLWNVGALIADSGRLFEWYRKAAGFEERPYGDLLEELIPSGYDPGIFAGDFFTPSVKAFPPLHDKTRLGRSVLSTIGFSVRSAIERLERSAFPVKEMRVSGGQGKNPRWNQLKADISGVSLLVPEIPDGELAGNAVLAASALGSEPCTVDFLSAAQKMIRFREVYKPTDETASFWDERYRLYKLHIGEVYGV